MNSIVVIVLLVIAYMGATGTADAHATGHRVLYVSALSGQDAAEKYPHDRVVVYRRLEDAVSNLRKVTS